MLNRNEIPKFDLKRYENLSLNELIVFSVFYLDQNSLQINPENITAAAFLLFNEIFQLHGYPDWPDSARVNKRWLDCRSRGYITGNTANDFRLTPKGYDLAIATAERLSGKRPIFRKSITQDARTRTHTRSGKFVKMIEQSDAFRTFKEKGNINTITEYDFRSMLMCTMETTSKVLRGNLNQFKQYVLDDKRDDLRVMLEMLEAKFVGILSQIKDSSKYEGGMFRRKTK